jgi:hypothetical protein
VAKATFEQVLGSHRPYCGIVGDNSRKVWDSFSGDSVHDGGQARFEELSIFSGIRDDDAVGAALMQPGRYIVFFVQRDMRVKNPGAVKAGVFGDAVQEPADVGPGSCKRQDDFPNF